MDRHVTPDDLLVYTLGESSDEDRARIDGHLCACGDCLRGFLDLKGHLERGLRPRPAVRDRLRAEVQQAFRSTPAARVRRALRRPIPLYQGLAAAALALAVSAFAPLGPWLGPRKATPPDPRSALATTPAAGARIDSARLSPESLTIY